ncbi:4-(cytidine 5'-diphospho)-2-C-methyl-D-erythritol kinase [Sphingosinicella sp.]|uniref:4-(cytidine 5'-diphospho)-2-C-methyl-D-erythritol kinase n=1 Tax=Sphingosinicella sp. TaxID=1917971 RepID=UPI0040380F26
MRETAFAKLNLALHVRARERDGYHRIETVFAFCEHGDVLTAEPGDGLSLRVTGPFAADLANEPDNLVLKAARALGVADMALTLEKNLPVASGIGGGSADAAAALRLLGGDREDLPEIAASLGADVPACLASRTARGEGRGDRLTFIEDDGLAGTPVLLVNPRITLSTAAVFAAWDGVDRAPLDDWRNGRNDLEAPARRLVPEIGAALDALSGASLARMSGSGATCFGLFGNEADRDEAQVRIVGNQPSWWTLTSRLR